MATAAHKTKTFSIGPDDVPEKEMKRWLDVQLFHENLAERKDVAERAVRHVTDLMRWYEASTKEIREKWAQIQSMLKFQSRSAMFPDSELHVPEMHKMLEAITPRVVEAIINVRPWFKVDGRDKSDREIAAKVQGLLLYMAQKDKIPERLDPFVRSAIIHSFAAWKTSWDVEYQKQVKRKVTKTRNDQGLWDYKIEAEEVNALAFEGARARLIDPLCFVIDPRATTVEEADFVGDVRMMDEQQLRQMQSLGIYANVDLLLEKDSQGKALGKHGPAFSMLSTEWFRQSRALDTANVFHDRAQKREGEPRKFEIQEVWRKYQPADGMEFEEYQITCCDGVALAVRKNPYDDKHRPYVVYRTSKDPHDFFNVGPLDPAVPLNVELDDHRNLARRAHAMSLSPVLLSSTTDNLPTTLWDAMPGAVYHVEDAKGIAELKTSSTLGEIVGVMEYIRRDIEEAIGAPRIFEGGAGGGGTATEIERKVQEGNRRLRPLVVNLSEALAELLTQFYALSQQFVTRKHSFAVLNQDAKAVFDIAPDDLQDPIDIWVRGPAMLEFNGLRVTQIQSWMSAAGALLPVAVQNGELNVSALLQELWTGMVGYELGENVLRVPQSERDMMDPADENLILLHGGSVQVHEMDDDEQHNRAHDAAAQLTDDQDKQDRIYRHIAEHTRARNRKLIQQAAQSRPRMAAFPTPTEGAVPASRHKPGEGRYFQREPDLMGDVAGATPPGETPGPARSGSIAASDREPAVNQTQNRR